MKARSQRRLRRARRAQEEHLRAVGVPPLRAYWEARYATGADSGAGSSGEQAHLKAAYVNELVRRERVTSVVDWGCGDGQQLVLLDLPAAYLGVDISASAVAQCIQRHPGRAFLVWPADGPAITVRADLALSLDVVFHLVSDADFEDYWGRLFASAERLVLVHSTDYDGHGARHVRHRRINHLTPTGWQLVGWPIDPTTPGFYLWRASEGDAWRR